MFAFSQSTGIATGVYNGNWMEGDTRFQKCLLLVIQRSQKAQTLTAYKFSVASLISVANVCSIESIKSDLGANMFLSFLYAGFKYIMEISSIAENCVHRKMNTLKCRFLQKM